MESLLTPRSASTVLNDPNDINPRPIKRLRVSKGSNGPQLAYEPIPQPQLLLALPSLLHHPPTHKYHKRALELSRLSLKSCLENITMCSSLDKPAECRAWTELAELSFKIGLDQAGVETDVETGITKALLIANKHPSLRSAIPSLTVLSARLSAHRGQTKAALASLKKLITHFLVPNDEPALVYRIWLAYISFLCGSTNAMTNAKALTALRDFHSLATENGHEEIANLVSVMEVKECMDQGMWMRVGTVLEGAEKALGLQLDVEEADNSTKQRETTAITPSFNQALTILVLLYGTLYHTYTGSNADSQSRMKRLHQLLDNNALDAFGVDGVVSVLIPPNPNRSESTQLSTIEIQLPHPKHIYTLSFLVSAVSKRDPVGRNPKRRLFAKEGCTAVEREIRKEVFCTP